NVTNTSGTAGLTWWNTTPVPTVVTTFSPVDPWPITNITNISNHLSPEDQPLPVTLTSFNAKVNTTSGGVLLEWKTASEVNNYGYTVQRKGADDAEFADLSGAFIPGKGTTLDPQSYSYVDRSIDAVGSYTYRLKQQDMDGTIHYSGTIVVQMTLTDVAEMAPREFKLMQNYPNPFNPATQIKFSVETSGRAVLTVYNLLGERVATLFDGAAEAGRYYVATFDAAGLASGIYLYRLTTEQKNDVHKMLLLR
ncbi:MAG: T9SS type A sorting domain-containing protein, partial [Bacteroidetes bacterium]|nr:T9SS type A sorting domain-containing protein [Bacteroidota bacterium]